MAQRFGQLVVGTGPIVSGGTCPHQDRDGRSTFRRISTETHGSSTVALDECRLCGFRWRSPMVTVYRINGTVARA